MTPPAAEAVGRFRADVVRLLGQRPAGPLALAVSGGPDSMAMLALAASAFPGQVIAATVDHGLRPTAADEAAMVADWCRAASIPHETLVVAEPIGATAIHERARTLRYGALARWALDACAACIATAHHADDQAETFLMRAVRGSGTAGLAGIRKRRVLTVREDRACAPGDDRLACHEERFVPLVRPLLDWRRATLREIAEGCGLPFVDDPSNADPRFERSGVRRLLAEQPWLDAAQLARAAAHVGEAHAALEAMRDWLWNTRRLPPDDDPQAACEVRLDLAGLPRELKRRLARDAIAVVRAVEGIGTAPVPATIEPLLDSVEAGRAATQTGVLVSRRGDLWHFREAPPRRTSHRTG